MRKKHAAQEQYKMVVTNSPFTTGVRASIGDRGNGIDFYDGADDVVVRVCKKYYIKYCDLQKRQNTAATTTAKRETANEIFNLFIELNRII